MGAILEGLLVMNPGQRWAFFEQATKSQIVILKKASLNQLKNPSGLTKADLAGIQKYKSTIYRLASHTITGHRKEKVLQQRGGFVTALLPLLATVVTSILNR